MLAFDKTVPKTDTNRSYWGNPAEPVGAGPAANVDPMTGLMSALSRNPQAATTFFDPQGQNPDAIHYLVAEHDWQYGAGAHAADDGKAALGHALSAAVVRPGEAADARTMSTLVNVLGGELHGNVPGAMTPGITDAVQTYITSGDVNNTDRPHALLDTDNTRVLLSHLAQNPDHYKQLMSAELAYGSRHLPQSHTVQTAENAARGMGGTIGALVHGQTQSVYYQHAAADARQNLIYDRFFTAADILLDKIPTPEGITGDVQAQTTQSLAGYFRDHLEQDTTHHAMTEAGSDYVQAYRASKLVIQNAAQDSGHFNEDDVTAIGLAYKDAYDGAPTAVAQAEGWVPGTSDAQ